MDLTPTPSGLPERIGEFKVLEELNRGGMGVVYLAEQEQPIRRRVALKLLLLGMDTRELIARFEAECQTLAMMNHPHIAKVLAAGTISSEPGMPASQAGRPYLVMEYVPGMPITRYCDLHRLDIADRLHLFIQVCQAIQHAHQKGIIHHDIKPANVLVAEQDGMPVPKVIDFGLAKAMHQGSTGRLPVRGLGTPGYMSPEQLELSAASIDTTTDVYSLGVLLYELLAGVLPFGVPGETSERELRRCVREEDPPSPSARLGRLDPAVARTIAASRTTDLRGLKKQLRGDLDCICLSALTRERSRRYPTASELAADVARHLEGAPVVVRPPSTAYLLHKFYRRNKGLCYAATAVLIALMASAGVMVWQWQEARRERDAALLARGESREAADKAVAAKERALEAARAEARQRHAAREAAAYEDRQRKPAVDAIHRLVFDAQDKLRGVPAAQHIRVGLLNTALKGMQRIADEYGPTASVDRTRAAVYVHVGDLALEAGRTDESAEWFQRASDLLQQLHEADPENASAKQDLLRTCDKLGDVLLAQGRAAAARDAFRKALAIHEALHAADPQHLDVQRALAMCHERLAGVSLRLDHRKPAREYAERCLKHYSAVAAMEQMSVRSQFDLARCYGILGLLELRVRDFPLAQQHFEQGLRHLMDLDAAAKLQQLAEGGKWLQDLEKNRALCRSALRAVADLEFALAQPANEALELLRMRALALADRGRHADAAETAAKLRDLKPEDAENLFNVACCYALCVSAVAVGKKPDHLSTAEREFKALYTTRALDVLTQAIEHGFKNVTRLEENDELGSLREHPRYRELVERLKKGRSIR